MWLVGATPVFRPASLLPNYRERCGVQLPGGYWTTPKGLQRSGAPGSLVPPQEGPPIWFSLQLSSLTHIAAFRAKEKSVLRVWRTMQGRLCVCDPSAKIFVFVDEHTQVHVYVCVCAYIPARTL